MKFKHLLLLPFISLFIISCSKNGGDNFTFTPKAAIAADTTGGTTAATPVTVTVGADSIPYKGDNSNLLFGNPSGATADIVVNKNNYLINQGYYVESYNSTNLEPNWVSWHLDASNIGTTKRQDSFAAFAGLPFTQVQSTSYQPYATYGFDRGHNCPSADRTSSLNANNSTFLMTNMIPQAPYNNQQTWGNLEDYIRSLVTAGNEAYIIMGSYGTGGVGLQGAFNKIGTLGINVPQNVWKIAVILPVGSNDITRVTASTRVIAVNTPNIQTINSNWKLYITTVDAIEKATGYNLLSALPQTVKDAIKVKVDPGS